MYIKRAMEKYQKKKFNKYIGIRNLYFLYIFTSIKGKYFTSIEGKN